MRHWTAITLAVCCAAEMLLGPAAVAQQSEGPRRIISKIDPRYPDLARPMRLEGAVKLSVVVGPNGSVKSIEGVGGNPLLLKAAQDAINRWRWAPAPQETTERIELRFHP
jgi:TonB family protein